MSEQAEMQLGVDVGGTSIKGAVVDLTGVCRVFRVW